MKVLVIGSGAREHALVRALTLDPTVAAVIAAPGSPGTDALALTVPLVIAALFVLGKANYKVILDLQTHRVVVGTRAVGRVEVANPTQRDILPSRIELAVGQATAQFLVPRLAAAQSHEELFAVPTKRRAVLVVGPVRSVRDDPLSLMRRQVTWAKEQELFVHPRTVRLDEAASGFLRDLEGTPSSDLSSSDIAFHALIGHAAANSALELATAPMGLLLFSATRDLYRAVPAARHRLLDAHRAIADAIAARDAAGAAEWMRRHIADFRRGYEVAGFDLDAAIELRRAV